MRTILSALTVAALLSGCSVALTGRPGEYAGNEPRCHAGRVPAIVDAAIAAAAVGGAIVAGADVVDAPDGTPTAAGVGAFAFGASAAAGFAWSGECRGQRVAAAEGRAPRHCVMVDGWPQCFAGVDACEARRAEVGPSHAGSCQPHL